MAKKTDSPDFSLPNRNIVKAHQGLKFVGQSNLFPFDVSLVASHNRRRLEPLSEAVSDAQQVLVREHVKHDPKTGRPVEENNEYVFKSAEDREKYLADLKALMDKEESFEPYTGSFKTLRDHIGKVEKRIADGDEEAVKKGYLPLFWLDHTYWMFTDLDEA